MYIRFLLVFWLLSDTTALTQSVRLVAAAAVAAAAAAVTVAMFVAAAGFARTACLCCLCVFDGCVWYVPDKRARTAIFGQGGPYGCRARVLGRVYQGGWQ